MYAELIVSVNDYEQLSIFCTDDDIYKIGPNYILNVYNESIEALFLVNISYEYILWI